MYIQSLVNKYDNEEMNKWENEKMKNRNILIRCVLMLWMVCGGCHTASMVYAYDQSTQPSKSWGYQPVYQSTATTSYVPAAPTCQFHSTSVLIPAARGVGQPAVIANNTPRRSPWDGEPGDDDYPTGVVPDPVDMPVGDIPWLFILILAAGYLAFRYRKKSALIFSF